MEALHIVIAPLQIDTRTPAEMLFTIVNNGTIARSDVFPDGTSYQRTLMAGRDDKGLTED